jgi:hypothetical protein
MRYCLFLLIVAAIVPAAGCEQTDARQEPQTDTKSATAKQSTVDDKPLLLEDEPLLLLDDPPRADEPNGPIADNSRCFVCHINYMQEDIAVAHARRHIGCAHCHGESDEHIADESWASGGSGTAPDKMYTRQMINPFCLSCHPKDKTAGAWAGKLSQEPHKALFAESGDEKYCTDCHGDHRLKDRKCKWK